MPAKKEPAKRGVKGHFTGSREEFLTGYLAEYQALRGKSHQQFWDKTFNEWWQRYPWRLSIDDEPPTEDRDKMAELAYAGEEDNGKKAKVEAELCQKIKSWYSYRSTRHTRRDDTYWTPILKSIHKKANSKPRCRNPAQQLNSEKANTVNNAFNKLYGDAVTMPRGERMNKRNEVAKSLVQAESEADIKALKQRAKQEHERALKEWELELDSIEEAEDVHGARDSLFSAVHPLLKFIGKYSGCYVTLVAAAASKQGTDKKPYFSAIHHFPADSTHLNWTEFDEEGFKSGVVAPFFKYIRHMENGKSNKEESVESVSPETAPTDCTGPSPTGLLNSTSSGPKQLEGNKKRTFNDFDDPEDTSGSDEDDMEDVEDNDSSGSSVESDHVPAKRLRTSIATRSSKAAVIPKRAIGEVSARRVDHNPTLRNSHVEPSPSTTPPQSHLGLSETDVGDPRISPGIQDDASCRAHIHQPIDVMDVTPSQPASSSHASDSGPEVPIPGFLEEGKHNIYGYLSSVKEARFQDLLEKYILFECTDRSGITGTLTTCRRPNAVKWWSSRARTNKLPPFDSLKSFSESIVQWWIVLQPEWRKIKVGKVSRTGGNFDDWEYLYQPGLNGLLNVVILAHWWAKILGTRETPVDASYIWFVSDVSWVLSQLSTVAPDAY